MLNKYPKSIIFISAFVIRLIFSIYTGQLASSVHFDDESKYYEAAVSLAEKNQFEMYGHKTSWHGPGFSFVLSIFHRIWDGGIIYLRLINMIIGSFIPLMVFLIIKRYLSNKLAYITALYVVFYPPLIFWNQYLLSEEIYSLGLLLLVFSIAKYQENPISKKVVLIGLLFGLVSYVRPLGLLTVPIFIFWHLVVLKNKISFNKSISNILIVTGLFIIIILPWTMRNYNLHNKLIPMNTNGGVNLLQGNNPISWDRNNPMRGSLTYYESSELALFFPEGQLRLNQNNKEAVIDSLANKKAVSFIKHNYAELPKVLIYKFIKLFKIYPYNSTLIVKIGMVLSYGLLLPFIVFGFFRIVQNSHELSFLLVPIISTIISSLIFYGMPRLRLPIDPLLIIIGFIGIDYLLKIATLKKGTKKR